MKKKNNSPSQMDRARAARALVEVSGSNAEAANMAAFLSIFHPELPREKFNDLVRDVQNRRRNK